MPIKYEKSKRTSVNRQRTDDARENGIGLLFDFFTILLFGVVQSANLLFSAVSG